LELGKVGFGRCASKLLPNIIIDNVSHVVFVFRTGGVSCYDEFKVCKLIVASIVLHNFCIQKEIPLLEADDEFRNLILIPEYAAEHNYNNLTIPQAAILARTRVITTQGEFRHN